MDKYEVLETLGQGAYGVVVKCRNKETGDIVAVKKVQDSDYHDAAQRASHREEAMSEVRLLAQFEHINITHYYECIVEDNCLNIVMEYARCGDLAGAIAKHASEKKPFTEDEIMFWFVQIVLALFHVHSKNILHRDMKSQNVFVAEDNILKLGDFGIARVLNSDTELVRTVIGTPYYLSPEICEDKAYNRKSDVWALGCVLYELCTLRKAFDGQSLPALVVKILTGKYPPIPPRYSPQLRALVDSMLKQAPAQRPSVDAILRGDFVRGHVERYAVHVMALPGNDLTPGALGINGKMSQGAAAKGAKPPKARKPRVPSRPAVEEVPQTPPTPSAQSAPLPASERRSSVSSSPTKALPVSHSAEAPSPDVGPTVGSPNRPVRSARARSSALPMGRPMSPAPDVEQRQLTAAAEALSLQLASTVESPSPLRPTSSQQQRVSASGSGLGTTAAASAAAAAKVLSLDYKSKRDADLEASKNAVLQERARQKAVVAQRSQEKASAIRSRAAQRQHEIDKNLEEQFADAERKARKAERLAVDLGKKEELKAVQQEGMRHMAVQHREMVKAVKSTISKVDLAKRGAEFVAQARLNHSNQVVLVEIEVPHRAGAAPSGFPPNAHRRPSSASSHGASVFGAASAPESAGQRGAGGGVGAPSATAVKPLSAQRSRESVAVRPGGAIVHSGAARAAQASPSNAMNRMVSDEPPPWKKQGRRGSSSFQPQVEIFTPYGSSLEDPPPPPLPPGIAARMRSPAARAPPPRAAAVAAPAAQASASTSFADDDDGMTDDSSSSSSGAEDVALKWRQRGKTDLIEVLSQIQDVLSAERPTSASSSTSGTTPSAARPPALPAARPVSGKAAPSPYSPAGPLPAGGRGAGRSGGPAPAASAAARGKFVASAVNGLAAGAGAAAAAASAAAAAAAAAPRRRPSSGKADGLTLPPEAGAEADALPSGWPSAGGVGAARAGAAAAAGARAAELRRGLQRELGQERLAAAYSYLLQLQKAENDDEGSTQGTLEAILGPHIHSVRMIHKLITLEGSVI